MEVDHVRLGATLIETADALDFAIVEILKSNTLEHLHKDYRHVDKQRELKGKIVNLVNEIKSLRSGDIDDHIYKRFREAANRANEIIVTEGGKRKNG